jgi:hypothetical protein
VIEEIEADPSATLWRPPRWLAGVIVATIVGAGALTAIATLGGAASPLVLPGEVADASLTFIPDRLANEPPAASLREPIAIRATTGLASVEGPATIAWTERGLSYRLESSSLAVADLVRIAASLR